MTKEEVLNIIQKCNKIDIDTISNYPKLQQIVLFIQFFSKKYNNQLSKYGKSKIRYCDYFSYNFNAKEMLEYFNEDYNRADKSEQLNLFIIYCIFKNFNELLEAIKLFGLEELETTFKNNVDDLNVLINIFQKNNFEEEVEEELDNLDFVNHKYKILFSGLSLDTFQSIEKNILKSAVSKICNVMAEDTIINKSKTIAHIKDKYGVPMMRVQVADDYRIIYIRKKGVTVILGIELKTGKDNDYYKYDKVADRIDKVYNEIELFNSGLLPSESDHFKTVDYIKESLKKNNKSK